MYPLDRRKVAFRLYAFLNSLRKTALLLNIHYSTVSRWLKSPGKKQYSRSQESLKSVVVIECIKTAIENDPFVMIRNLQK
jgi:DNA invertase Pin-like site-specific DNA recombinase